MQKDYVFLVVAENNIRVFFSKDDAEYLTKSKNVVQAAVINGHPSKIGKFSHVFIAIFLKTAFVFDSYYGEKGAFEFAKKFPVIIEGKKVEFLDDPALPSLCFESDQSCQCGICYYEIEV